MLIDTGPEGSPAVGTGARISQFRARYDRIDVRIWIFAFLFAALLFAISMRSEVAQIAGSIRATDPIWLTLLIIVALTIQFGVPFGYSLILRMLGDTVEVTSVVNAQLQRHALSTMVPAGSVPASLVFIRKLGAQGAESENVVLTLVIASVLGNLSFITLLIPTVILLASQGNASKPVEFGAAGLTLLVLFALVLSLRLISAQSFPDWVHQRSPARLMAFLERCKSRGIRPAKLTLPFLTSLSIDFLGVVLLYLSLRAAGVHPSAETALGGYVVGTLFLLIAPIFQGIGLVEVSMALALNHLGVTHSAAISATLLYRVGELWLPLCLGLALQARDQPQIRGLPARMPALLTAFTGAISVLSVMAPQIPHHHNRLEDYSIIDLMEASRTVALVGGFCLLLLSYALWRRRRVAWFASISLSLVVGFTHLTKHHDQSVAYLAFLNALLLVIYRDRFRVRNDVPSMRRGIAGFVASLLFAVIYGTLGFWLLDRREFGVEFSLPHSLTTSIRLYFSLGTAGLHPRTRYADWFLDSLSLVGILSIVTACISVMRPVVWRHRTLPQEQREAARLIAQYGRSSLDAFKATDDKLFFFSRERDAVICYGLSTGSAIVLGDPIAPDDQSRCRIISDFIDFSDANGWRVAFHQVPPDNLETYRSLGMETLKIGEEAIVDLHQFSLSGNSMKGLRAAVNRFERLGLMTVVHTPPLPEDLMVRLKHVSDEWLTLPGRRERAFTLGRWDDFYIRGSSVMTVEDADENLFAFVNLIPDGAAGEATFDLMRHLPDAPSGSMDFLLVRLIQYLAEEGYRRMSLGMAPWSEVGLSDDSTFIERRVGSITPRLGHFFSAQGLRAYKEKFRPVWEPRYLIYHSDSSLPRIALSIIRLTEGSGTSTEPATGESAEQKALDALASP